MIEKFISSILKQRFVVLIGIAMVLIFGVYRYVQLPVDAFPDISPVMVPIFAEAHGLAPEEVERLITFPIESAMNGLPEVTQIKSTSAFGMAVIYVYFSDKTDMYFARQIVSERLSHAMADLPELHDPPKLGPISTGLGQIFIYYLTLQEDVDTRGKDRDTYLREINDWIVNYQLQTVSGVTDILSMGGHVLQYQVQINPHALTKYDLTLDDVEAAIQANNRNAGGQFMVLGHEEYLVRGLGLLDTIEQIASIQIAVIKNRPVRIGDIGKVVYGKEIRRGVVTLEGKQEVVSGIVLQLYGANTSEVIKSLYEKIPEVQAALPKGVTIVPFYEQKELVEKATQTVKWALAIGAFLVMITLILFLGNWRAALIVVFSLPFCALVGVIGMAATGLSANLMTLGGLAIAIGMLGDGAIVVVENIYRYLSDREKKKVKKDQLVLEATSEVAKPIVFSVIIIIVVFLPLFTLQGVEGKMFSPLAYVITFALVGALLAALVTTPVLSHYFLKKESYSNHKRFDHIMVKYETLLNRVLTQKKKVLQIVATAFVGCLVVLPFVGTEFVPTLEEGSILIGVTMAPSISLNKATQTIMQMEKQIQMFPAVKHTLSRIGRPEAGSHPHPVNYAEVHIELHPKSKWPRSVRNKEELVEALNQRLVAFPGVQLNFTQPIQNAFDELLSGVKAQLAIKIFGDDLKILRQKAEAVKEAINDIEGLVDLSVEKSFGQPQVQIEADREACSRYGVSVDTILTLVEKGIGGEVIDQLYVETRRFGIHVRLMDVYRSDPESITSLLVRTEDGSKIPLGQVASVKRILGPIQINRENNQRRWMVQGNVRGRDLGSTVTAIQKAIKQKVRLPPGYFIEYGGQFENQRRAMKRLMIIVPVVLVLLFFMLYLAFNSFRSASLIIVNVPLALIGGMVGLLLWQEYLSVPAAVGFIALFGIAVQNGVVLVAKINQLRESGKKMHEAIVFGCKQRLRPVLMTASTTIIGLVPLLLSQGIGSEVQRPLAVVVIFGLVSSTLLTLLVIPALYEWFSGFSIPLPMQLSVKKASKKSRKKTVQQGSKK